MDVIKIGKFIAVCRKKANLTQAELAEKLNITDRAVSKWEVGKCLPDSSIMLDLCKILNISVNDLLSGEIVSMEEKQNKLEEQVVELVKIKEKNDKQLLRLETIMIVLSIIILSGTAAVLPFLKVEEWLKILLISIAVIICLITFTFCIKIEQVAGYYTCKKCGHKYVPKMPPMIWSMHMGRTRYMKCPKCGKKSWQKKVISKEIDE